MSTFLVLRDWQVKFSLYVYRYRMYIDFRIYTNKFSNANDFRKSIETIEIL